MRIRRRKTRAERAADLLSDNYLKLKGGATAARGAGTAAKGIVVYQVAKRRSLVKRIPLVVAGAGVAALVAFKALKGSGSESAPATS